MAARVALLGLLVGALAETVRLSGIPQQALLTFPHTRRIGTATLTLACDWRAASLVSVFGAQVYVASDTDAVTLDLVLLTSPIAVVANVSVVCTHATLEIQPTTDAWGTVTAVVSAATGLAIANGSVVSEPVLLVIDGGRWPPSDVWQTATLDAGTHAVSACRPGRPHRTPAASGIVVWQRATWTGVACMQPSAPVAPTDFVVTYAPPPALRRAWCADAVVPTGELWFGGACRATRADIVPCDHDRILTVACAPRPLDDLRAWSDTRAIDMAVCPTCVWFAHIWVAARANTLHITTERGAGVAAVCTEHAVQTIAVPVAIPYMTVRIVVGYVVLGTLVLFYMTECAHIV